MHAPYASFCILILHRRDDETPLQIIEEIIKIIGYGTLIIKILFGGINDLAKAFLY